MVRDTHAVFSLKSSFVPRSLLNSAQFGCKFAQSVWLVVQKLTLEVAIFRRVIHLSRVLFLVAFSDIRFVVDLANFVSLFTVTDNFAVV